MQVAPQCLCFPPAWRASFTPQTQAGLPLHICSQDPAFKPGFPLKLGDQKIHPPSLTWRVPFGTGKPWGIQGYTGPCVTAVGPISLVQMVF